MVKRSFEFQKNGLIILPSDIDSRTKNEFYLIDHKGIRTKVNQITDFKDRVNNMPVIVVSDVTGFSSNVINSTNSKITQVAGGATYMDFNLYNKDTTEIVNSLTSQKLDVFTNAAVNACRTNQ